MVEETPQTSAGSTYKPKDFLPISAQKRLEERRAKFGPGDRPADLIERRSQEAQQRRQVRGGCGRWAKGPDSGSYLEGGTEGLAAHTGDKQGVSKVNTLDVLSPKYFIFSFVGYILIEWK